MLKSIPADIQEAIDIGCTVFAGEAEDGRYESLLKEVWAGTAKPVYNYMKDLPNLPASPSVFAGLRDRPHRGNLATLDSGRGCPYQCSFCSIINVQGRVSRWRSPDDVEEVIRENYARGVRRFLLHRRQFCAQQGLGACPRSSDQAPEVDGLKFKFVSRPMRSRTATRLYRKGHPRRMPLGLYRPGKHQSGESDRRQEAAEQDLGVSKNAPDLEEARCDGLRRLHHWFPFDTRETILRDLEILKRELAIEVVEIFYLTPLPGSEDHQRLTNTGVWMDPDMNKYSLSERVTHHTKMSDEEWSRPTRKPGGATTTANTSSGSCGARRLRKTSK